MVEAGLLQRLYMVRVVNLVVREHAIVDLGSKSTWTEAALDHSVASLSTSSHSSAAAVACAIVIFFTWHAFTFIHVTVGGARSLFERFVASGCDWLC